MAPKFGKDIRDQFYLDYSVKHLNHGAFGVVPKPVFEARSHIIDQLEFHPDSFTRRYNEQAWNEQLDMVCDFLGWKPENTVFVENATSGITSVIRSVHLAPGDAIMLNTFTYLAVKNLCDAAVDRTGCEIVTVDLELPISSKQALIDAFASVLEQNPNIKVTVIDHISSRPAVMFPVKELTELCHNHGVIVIVDGAHAPGQVSVDVEDLGVDYYIGNLYKWGYANRGCSLLWTADAYRDECEPHLIGFGYQQSYKRKFYSQGTRDHSPFLSTKDAVLFYKSIGGVDAVAKYTSELLEKAIEYLSNQLGTERDLLPSDLEPPSMRMLRLPPELNYLDMNDTSETGVRGAPGGQPNLVQILAERYKIYVTTSVVNDVRSMRLCANVYNIMDDFMEVGTALKELCKKEKH